MENGRFTESGEGGRLGQIRGTFLMIE